MDDIKSLGADSVRSLVLWSRIAPRGSRRPRGFKAADPRSYSPAAWDPYDDLVRGTSVRGLGLHPLPLDADAEVGVALQDARRRPASRIRRPTGRS